MASQRFLGWEMQPFAAPDYLVAPHGDGAGIDTGIMASRDGQPRVVPVIRVADLDAATARIAAGGGAVVVQPFAIPGGEAGHASTPRSAHAAILNLEVRARTAG